MTKTNLALAVVLASVAVLVSGIFAQQDSARKEYEGDISGRVVMLTAAAPPRIPTVNKGGLTIVQISDTQGRPPRDISVNEGRMFKRLGQVRGVRTADGQTAIGGGGYTWVLLTPLKDGTHEISVSYTPNGRGEPIERVHRVEVIEE
jgi:hypothetical protein